MCQSGNDTLFAVTVPMILELTGGSNNTEKFKKIVFLTLYNHYFISDNQEDYYCNFMCHTWWYSKVDYNFTLYMKSYFSYEVYWETPLIEFTRNAVYDYTDELWEELNNRSIASSEMNFDNSSVIIGTSGVIDLSKPSVIQFNMKNNTINSEEDENDNNESVIEKITNPKTWNNGVVILVISMIVIIGSSMLIIKKRNVKV